MADPVAGQQHVASIDPFEHLDVESERLAAFFEDDPDWEAHTRCEGWNVRDMLGHVAGVETYHLACLDDAIGALFERAAAEGGVTDLDSFNAWAIESRRALPTGEVLAEWLDKNGEVRERMRALGRDGTMSSSVGPYPVGLMAFHVASEYATHADDVSIEIPPDEIEARMAWRLQVSLFALEESEKPVKLEREVDASPPAWRVTAEGAEATLTDSELVEAVAARHVGLDPRLKDALRALA